jgi:hypothetical protein
MQAIPAAMRPQVKRCTKCFNVKPLDGFYKRKDGKGGLNPRCKDCVSAYSKAARDQKPEAKAARRARDQKPEAKAARRARNATPEAKAARRAYEQIPDVKAAKRAREREPGYKAAKRARNATPEGLVERRCCARILDAKRVPGFSWGPFGEDLPRGAKGGPDSTIHLLGLAVLGWGFYAKYLTEMFYDGMNWDVSARFGIRHWQINHFRPLWTFDLDDPEQRRQAFHYTNTRPIFKGQYAQSSEWDDARHPLEWNGVKWVQKKMASDWFGRMIRVNFRDIPIL